MSTKSYRSQRAMTLVEAMVVVAMIGVLAALGIVGYSKWVRWAAVAETKEILSGLANGQAGYYADTQGYLDCSDDWNDADLYPQIPNSKKHPFHDPGHSNYDCFRMLHPTVKEPTYMSFWVRAGLPTEASYPGNPTGMATPTLDAGLRTPTRPWWMIVAVGNRDEDAYRNFFMTYDADPTHIIVENEDE